MKPSNRPTVCCQRIASELRLGIHLLEAISSKKGNGCSRRSISSTSMSPRARACFKIHCAGVSANLVGRVEPTMTAIRGFRLMVSSRELVSCCNQITKHSHDPTRRHFAETRLPGGYCARAGCSSVASKGGLPMRKVVSTALVGLISSSILAAGDTGNGTYLSAQELAAKVVHGSG